MVKRQSVQLIRVGDLVEDGTEPRGCGGANRWQIGFRIKEDAIEVKVNEEEMIVLSEVEVDKIIISKDKNKENFPDHVEGPVVVRSGNIPGLHCKFMVSIFEGEKVKLLKLITVKVTDVTVQEGGRTVRMQRFNQYNSYFYTAPGSFSEIKLKKKSILEALKHTDKVNSFLAKEKNKLKKEKDLLSLFKFYDTLF